MRFCSAGFHTGQDRTREGFFNPVISPGKLYLEVVPIPGYPGILG